MKRGDLIFRNKEAYVVVSTSQTGVAAINYADLDRSGVSRVEVSKMDIKEFERFQKEYSIRTLESSTQRKWPAKSEFKNVPGTKFWR